MHYAIRRLALYRAFDCLDADNNGTLDKDEWKKLFQQLHPNDEKCVALLFFVFVLVLGGGCLFSANTNA